MDSQQNGIALIWIDWYPYHHARLRALVQHPGIGTRAHGIELVGKTGVHKGLLFREAAEPELPLSTLFPDASWSNRDQLRLAIALWKKLDELNPAVVFVPGYYTLPGLASALWGKLKGRRTVLMTESTQHDHQRNAFKERFKGLLLRGLFHYAISGGKAHVRYLRALGFPSGRIAGRYDVVDNQYFASTAEKRRAEADAPVRHPYFLYTGRLASEKNVGSLIEAYGIYRRDGGTWPLVLVGGGPEEASLKACAAATGFSGDIHFAGLKTSRELPDYYAFAGCFVLPSSREPWGLVVNEAMASGLPVLVSNRCGCAEDLVHESENGFLFHPEDSGKLARLMMVISSMPESSRRAMAERSKAIVDTFSPKRWADEVASIEAASGDGSLLDVGSCSTYQLVLPHE